MIHAFSAVQRERATTQLAQSGAAEGSDADPRWHATAFSLSPRHRALGGCHDSPIIQEGAEARDRKGITRDHTAEKPRM